MEAQFRSTTSLSVKSDICGAMLYPLGERLLRVCRSRFCDREVKLKNPLDLLKMWKVKIKYH